jgi:hypothetical protein
MINKFTINGTPFEVSSDVKNSIIINSHPTSYEVIFDNLQKEFSDTDIEFNSNRFAVSVASMRTLVSIDISIFSDKEKRSEEIALLSKLLDTSVPVIKSEVIVVTWPEILSINAKLGEAIG